MGNILITSAGRRASLVKSFKEEAKKISPESKVLTAEANPEWSSACRVSDGFFRLPRITDDNYIDSLLENCLQKNISLIIPTIDTELSILAESKTLFKDRNIDIVISDTEFIAICRDKRNTNVLFEKLNIRIPAIIDRDKPSFPLFVKPYDGSLSQGIQLLVRQDELTEPIKNNPKLMFMEYIDPVKYDEYTIDAYYDKYNHLKCLVPRRRIEVRGGEISKGRTEKGWFYHVLCDKIKYMKGAVGCITFQFFIGKQEEELIGIEINPRFGGGYPLSYAAGANYPGYLIREYILHQEVKFSDEWVSDRVMLRYDAEIILDQNDFIN